MVPAPPGAQLSAREGSIAEYFLLPHLLFFMATAQPTTPKTSFSMGLFTGAVLIAYTTLAALLGFFDRIEAGSIDLLMLAGGTTLAIARRSKDTSGQLSYFDGFSTGIVTALVASVALGFGFIVLTVLVPHAMDLTRARDIFGFDLSVVLAFLAIILMGTMTGVISSLIAMQYFKVDMPDPMKSKD